MAKRTEDAAQRAQLIEEWVREHSGQVYRTALFYMKDHAAAEDVTQDTFVLAFRHMDSFRGKSSPATWLMRIAANRAKEVLRSRWHRSVSPSEDWEAQAAAIAAGPSPEEELSDREDMLRALGKLDDKSRRALLLHYYYGFRDREIAVIEDLSPSAVRKRLERGRKRLGELLAEDGKGPNHEPG